MNLVKDFRGEKTNFHRGEAMYISFIDFMWSTTETKSY